VLSANSLAGWAKVFSTFLFDHSELGPLDIAAKKPPDILGGSIASSH
jgi:hypothetical protein